jgi:hypothetical protein
MPAKRKIESSEFADFIVNVSSTLERYQDNETLITELRSCVENAETILDFLKNKPKAFSSIQYNDLVGMNDAMKWKLPKDLHDIPDFTPQLIRVPEYVFELIKSELETKTQTIGILSTTNNEAKRKPFIDTFINSCINMFQGEITNDMEGYISSSKFQGRIEYILKSFSDVIMVVIEAKKDIEYQANYGQIIAELYGSYCYNKTTGRPVGDVYGILTTGENWQWWKYDGKSFYASAQFYELRKQNPRSLPTITSYVYSLIINAWIETCKINLSGYNERFNDCKTAIFQAKNNDNALEAFDKLKKIIHEVKDELGHSDEEWNYETDYM